MCVFICPSYIIFIEPGKVLNQIKILVTLNRTDQCILRPLNILKVEGFVFKWEGKKQLSSSVFDSVNLHSLEICDFAAEIVGFCGRNHGFLMRVIPGILVDMNCSSLD